MIRIEFNTETHSMGVYIDDLPRKNYSNVSTIKVVEGYYDVMVQLEDGRKAPILRTPIGKTIIQYEHK